jgi:LPS export ABC transporter protein LptC
MLFQNKLPSLWSYVDVYQRELLSALSLLGSFFFLFGIWRLDQSDLVEETTVISTEYQAYPSFEVYDFHAHFYDQTGKEVYEIRSNELFHFEHRQFSVLQNPIIFFFAEPLHYWKGAAKIGKLFQNASDAVAEQTGSDITLELFDAVSLQEFKSQVPFTELNTNYLKYTGHTNEIYTHLPVKITQKNHTATSKGLSANLNARVYTLTEKAKVLYQAPTQP